MAARHIIILSTCSVVGTLTLGTFAKNLHELYPTVFQKPSAFPYLDSFVTVVSIATTFFMIQKKIESWVAWIIVNLLATYLYLAKGIKFIGIQYLIFAFISAYGLWNWIREYRSYGGGTRYEVRDTKEGT